MVGRLAWLVKSVIEFVKIGARSKADARAPASPSLPMLEKIPREVEEEIRWAGNKRVERSKKATSYG